MLYMNDVIASYMPVFGRIRVYLYRCGEEELVFTLPITGGTSTVLS